MIALALDRLGVTPRQTLFVDDHQTYCDAAAALGIQAVRIDRSGTTADVSDLITLLPRF